MNLHAVEKTITPYVAEVTPSSCWLIESKTYDFVTSFIDIKLISTFGSPVYRFHSWRRHSEGTQALRLFSEPSFRVEILVLYHAGVQCGEGQSRGL